jgi:hypothetical protein
VTVTLTGLASCDHKEEPKKMGKDKKGKKGKKNKGQQTEAVNPDAIEPDDDDPDEGAEPEDTTAVPDSDNDGAPAPGTEADDSGDPYGEDAATPDDSAPPLVAAHEDMEDAIFIKHLQGRHSDILKGQTKIRAGAALRPYRGLHMRVHNAGIMEMPHVHDEPDTEEDEA